MPGTYWALTVSFCKQEQPCGELGACTPLCTCVRIKFLEAQLLVEGHALSIWSTPPN